MNAAFNTMAKRYNGRAVASENLKENYVTIHIETGGSIVQHHHPASHGEPQAWQHAKAR